MDKVRFGRALGYGARHAAKALTQAVDAATAPSASTPPARPSAQRTAAPVQQTDVRQHITEASRTILQAHQTVQQTKSQFRGAAKAAGKSALAPVAKFSSVLWLQVTGTFFALVAAALCEAVWKLHGAWTLPAFNSERLKLYFCAALAALFLYFTLSNFVRASRRQRR